MSNLVCNAARPRSLLLAALPRRRAGRLPARRKASSSRLSSRSRSAKQALPPIAERLPRRRSSSIRRKRTPPRRTGRRDRHARAAGARHPLHLDLRLYPPRRLRREPQAQAGHPRELRQRGRPGLHLHPPGRPPLVGRPPVHGRGFPLLLGGRRAEQGRCPRPACRSSCWSTASPPQFEVLDERTVRYTWDKPNPRFLPQLAGAARPGHLSAPRIT